MSVGKYNTKSGKAKWYASIRYVDWTGKTKQKKKEGFDRKSDAQKYEREFQLKNNRSCDMLFRDLVELYREDLKNRTRATTQRTRDNITNTHILPYYGDMIVNKIDVRTIRMWQNEMMAQVNPKNGKPYSQTYLRTINSRLSAIFNFAVNYCGLQKNPCHLIKPMGKKRDREMLFWTLDEFNQAIVCVDKWRFRIAFQILFWSGIREGELLALNVGDIGDGAPAAIHIDKTYDRYEGKDNIGPPKTDNSYRDVTIPSFLFQEIKKYIDALYGIELDDRLFDLTKSGLVKELHQCAKKAGVKEIRVHDLRHSHAAMMVELGYSLNALAERLGDTLDIVEKHYAHLYPGTLDRLAGDLEHHALKNNAAELPDLLQALEEKAE